MCLISRICSPVDVGMRLLQCLDRPQQAAALLFHVNVQMVVDVVSVIDRRTLDLVNRRVNLLNGDVLAGINLPVPRLVIQEPTRRA